eukprot:gene13928-19858_t
MESMGDRSATFAVTSASGQAALCPGQTHSLRVVFPSPDAEFFLTTSQGTFGKPYTAACPNQIAAWLTSADNSYTDTVAITCDMTGAVQLLVSWSESKRDSYHQATLTMNVDPSCAAAESPIPILHLPSARHSPLESVHPQASKQPIESPSPIQSPSPVQSPSPIQSPRPLRPPSPREEEEEEDDDKDDEEVRNRSTDDDDKEDKEDREDRSRDDDDDSDKDDEDHKHRSM